MKLNEVSKVVTKRELEANVGISSPHTDEQCFVFFVSQSVVLTVKLVEI